MFTAEGGAICACHLFKMSGQASRYNYLMIGDWPGRDGYAKVHSAHAYKETANRNPVMRKLCDTEIYGRYEEVK